jgi:hypothetical protein
MNDIQFYSDWLFYGGCTGVLGSVLTVIIYGKKIGANNLNWKHYSVIITIFMFPTVILPILLTPGIPLSEKIGVSIALTLFAAARYYATTKRQEAKAEIRGLRENNKTQKEKQD